MFIVSVWVRVGGKLGDVASWGTEKDVVQTYKAYNRPEAVS